jgi:hypothetical protein
MVQGDDEVRTRHGKDGVDIKVILRELIVLWVESVIENRPWSQAAVGEDDVPSQVVPGGHLAERDDPADPGRL